MLDLKANFRKVCTEKQSGTGTSARVHATYIRVCRRAGALPSPVLFLVRSAVGLVHTFNACNDSQACFAGAISPAQFIKQKRSRNRGEAGTEEKPERFLAFVQLHPTWIVCANCAHASPLYKTGHVLGTNEIFICGAQI